MCFTVIGKYFQAKELKARLPPHGLYSEKLQLALQHYETDWMHVPNKKQVVILAIHFIYLARIISYG